MKNVLLWCLPLVLGVLVLTNVIRSARGQSASQPSPPSVCEAVTDLEQDVQHPGVSPLTREAVDHLQYHCEALHHVADADLTSESALPAVAEHLNAMRRWLVVAELAATVTEEAFAERVAVYLAEARQHLQDSTDEDLDKISDPRLSTWYNQFLFLQHRAKMLGAGDPFMTERDRQQYILWVADLLVQIESHGQHSTTTQAAA